MKKFLDCLYSLLLVVKEKHPEVEMNCLLQVVIVVFVRRLYIFHLYFTTLLHDTDR